MFLYPMIVTKLRNTETEKNMQINHPPTISFGMLYPATVPNQACWNPNSFNQFTNRTALSSGQQSGTFTNSVPPEWTGFLLKEVMESKRYCKSRESPPFTTSEIRQRCLFPHLLLTTFALLDIILTSSFNDDNPRSWSAVGRLFFSTEE